MYFVLASSDVLFNVFQNDVQSQNYIFSETEKFLKFPKIPKKFQNFPKFVIEIRLIILNLEIIWIMGVGIVGKKKWECARSFACKQ